MHKFKSRKFLLAVFAQIAGLAILFFPEHESAISEGVTKGGALLLMALSAAGWIKGEAAIDQERVRGEQYRMMQADAGRHKRGEDAGGIAGKVAPLVGLVLMLGMLGGCVAVGSPAATPEDAWYEARRDLNTANQVYLAWSRAADLNDPDQAKTVVDWGRGLQRARVLLASAKTHLPDGGIDFDTLLDTLEALLVELADEQEPDDERAEPDSGGAADDPLPVGRLPSPPGTTGTGGPDHRRAA